MPVVNGRSCELESCDVRSGLCELSKSDTEVGHDVVRCHTPSQLAIETVRIAVMQRETGEAGRASRGRKFNAESGVHEIHVEVGEAGKDSLG